jgi:hypothetical protein
MFIFCDGCDAYAVNADLAKRWASAGSAFGFGSGAGKFLGGSITASATTGAALISPALGGISNLNQMLGFYFKCASAPTGSQLLAELDGASGASGLLYVDNAGHLFGRIGSPTGTALIPSTLINICDNNYHWIEVQFASGGTLTFYIDSVSCGAISGGGTPLALTQFQLWPIGVAYSVDDLILWDTSATNSITGTANQSFSAFPMGARQISTIRPSSDNSVQFATVVGGSGGTHFSAVNEVSPDGDTSYCQDAASGHQDSFGFGALSYTPAAVQTVVLNAYLKQGSPGSINNTLVAISGSTTGGSAAQATGAPYALRQVNFDSDPNTTMAWAASAVNAAKFGYKNS